MLVAPRPPHQQNIIEMTALCACDVRQVCGDLLVFKALKKKATQTVIRVIYGCWLGEYIGGVFSQTSRVGLAQGKVGGVNALTSVSVCYMGTDGNTPQTWQGKHLPWGSRHSASP